MALQARISWRNVDYICLIESCYYHYYFTAHIFFPVRGSPSAGIRWAPGNLPHTLTKLAFIMACQSSIAATVFLIPTPVWKAVGPAGRHGESTHSVLHSATLHISHSPRTRYLCFVSFLLLPALVRCTCLKQLFPPQRLMVCSPLLMHIFHQHSSVSLVGLFHTVPHFAVANINAVIGPTADGWGWHQRQL